MNNLKELKTDESIATAIDEMLLTFNEDNIKYVMKAIYANYKHISYSNKPTLVIIGSTAIGKSTMINALLGHKFETRKITTSTYVYELKDSSNTKQTSKNEDILDKEISDEEFIKEVENLIEQKDNVASIGKGDGSETNFPYRCSSNDLPFGILDIRGFFCTKGNIQRVLAASIMLDVYLHKKSKVIVVYLNSYSNYTTVDYFFSMEESINGFYSNLDVEFYIVANKFEKPVQPEIVNNFNETMEYCLREDFWKICEAQIKDVNKQIEKNDKGKEINELRKRLEKEHSEYLYKQLLEETNKSKENNTSAEVTNLYNTLQKYKYLSILKNSMIIID